MNTPIHADKAESLADLAVSTSSAPTAGLTGEAVSGNGAASIEADTPPRSREEMLAALADGVRENGTVEGHYVETYYGPCKGVMTDHRLQCLRVLIDDNATDIEARVLFESLIAEGWTPPAIPMEAAAPSIKAAPMDSYSPEDQAFYGFWYGHMKCDLMQPPLAEISHSTARYIWDAAIAKAPTAEVIRNLLWDEHPECCGNAVVGAEYMGAQEMVCCGCPEPAMLNDAQIVATLRAKFHDSLGTPQPAPASPAAK